MPVQINEVIIRAVVDNTASTTTPAAAPGSTSSQAKPDIEIAALVLEIIKEKKS